MPMGVSPVETRSAEGAKDSTKRGFVAPRSRAYLSAFSLPMILYRLPSHCIVVVCCVGSGITTLPLYLGLNRSSRDLGASAGFISPLLYTMPIGVLRYTGPRSGSTTSLGNALAAGDMYLAKTPSFFMTKIAPLLFTMTSKTGLPARNSAKARSITLVAEARQYSTVRPVFLLNASVMGSTVLDSREPYAMILPPSFFAASMSFASWAATSETANRLVSSRLIEKTAARVKNRN